MSKLSSSPDRHQFQLSKLLEQLALGKTTSEHVEYMTEFYKSWNQRRLESEADPAWREHNLEYDLRSTDWIVQKVRHSDSYAQNLYAAMCNRYFVKNEVWPQLKDQRWSCSWRYAGGIVADMREQGDYIDWYCSGIAGGDEPGVYDQGHDLKRKGFVPESTVTEEIRSDLFKLGWVVLDEDID